MEETGSTDPNHWFHPFFILQTVSKHGMKQKALTLTPGFILSSSSKQCQIMEETGSTDPNH